MDVWNLVYQAESNPNFIFINYGLHITPTIIIFKNKNPDPKVIGKKSLYQLLNNIIGIMTYVHWRETTFWIRKKI